MLSDKTLKAWQKRRKAELHEWYEYKGLNLEDKIVYTFADIAKMDAQNYYFGCHDLNNVYWERKQKLIRRLQNLKMEQSEIEIDKAIKIIKQMI